MWLLFRKRRPSLSSSQSYSQASPSRKSLPSMLVFRCKKKVQKKDSLAKQGKKQVRIADPEVADSFDSKRTLPTQVFKKLTLELKISYRNSYRRIMVEERMSYNGLVKEMKKLFDLGGPIVIYYEDDGKDLVKVKTSMDVKAMLVMTKRRDSCTRLFVRKV